jgi:hypothetical protein
MSSTLALPESGLRSALVRQWVMAHVVAAAVCVVTAFAASGLAKVFGFAAKDATPAAKYAAVALVVIVEVIYALTYAYLRGAVLRQLLPKFPMRAWCLVIVGMILAIATVAGFSANTVTKTPQTASAFTADKIPMLLLAVSIASLVIGLIIGTIEALVLRRVATGGGVWAMLSSVAFAAGAIVFALGSSLVLLQPGLGEATMLLASLVLRILMQGTVGLVMIPGLRSLQPR